MAVTGNLGDQPIVLNNAAEEATLERLVELFEQKFADQSGVKKTEAKAIEDNVKANKSYNDIVQSTSRGLGQFEENVVSIGTRMKETTQKLVDAGASIQSAYSKIGEDGAGMGDALKSITGPAAGGLSKMGGAAAVAGGSLNALAFVTGVAMGVFDSTVKTFYDLTKSGATFGGDMIRMRNAANQSGTTLEDFSKAVSANASGLSQFAGGTTEGAMVLSNMTRAARDNQSELVSLGVSYRDTPEFLGQFVGDLSNAGFSLKSFGGDFNRVAKTAVTYRKDLQALSEITGKTLEQQEAESKKLATDAAFQSVLADMNVEQAASMKALMASMSPLEQQMLKEQMVLGTFGSETAAAAATMPGVAGRVTDVANALKRGESDMTAVYANSSTVRSGQLRQDAATAREYAKMGVYTNNTLTKIGEENAIFLSRQAEQNAAAAGNLKEVREQQAIQQELTKNIAEREKAMQQIRTAFQQLGTALIDSGIVGVITSGMGMLADAISGVAEFIDGDLTTALLVGISGLFAGAAVMSVVKKSVSGLFGGAGSIMDSVLGDGGKGSKVSSGVGKGGAGGARAGAGIGNFIGQMGAGVMRGAAAGLKAFANPAILIGAGIFAGSIAVIGAGVAAASWLLGKSLPTLIDGIKSFEELDGKALLDASLGMVAIAGAMAAFGAGSAVAGLGTLVGGITEGIGRLFGAEDPMEKLVRFASYDIDAARVKQNSEAMVAFSTAMAASGGGSAVSGLGSLVGSIAGGISSLFGGDSDADMMDKLQKFGSYVIPVANIENNARAMVAYSNAMNSVGTIGNIQSATAMVVDGIGNLFGSDLDPIEDMKRFGAIVVPVANIENNARAMVAYGVAMSAFGQTQSAGLKDIASGIAQGITNFFKGDSDPFADLTKFAETKLDTSTIENNASAVTAYAAAMSELVSTQQAGLGDVVSAIASGITGFFGGTSDPMQDLIKFSAHDLNVEKVENNAKALIAYTNAMSSVSASGAAAGLSDIVSSIAEGILSFFGAGGNEIPFDKIKEFASHDLDVDGVKNTVAAVHEFTTGLASFGQISIPTAGDQFEQINVLANNANHLLSQTMPDVVLAQGGAAGATEIVTNNVIPFVDSLIVLQEKLKGLTSNNPLDTLRLLLSRDQVEQNFAYINNMSAAVASIQDTLGVDETFSYIDNMTAAVIRLGESLDELAIKKEDAFSELFTSNLPGIAAPGAASATAGATTAAGQTGMFGDTSIMQEIGEKQNALLLRLTEAYERNSQEGNDRLKRLANDL